RFGFSPHAILRPYFAPGNFIPWTVRAGTTLSTTLRPPIRFADPGSTCSVVTPPARLRGNCGSCGHTECSAHTFAVTGFVASFPSLSAWTPGAAYTPRCEWVSIIPGVTYLPLPSITVAPAGTVALGPTATIFPSATAIIPFLIVGPAAVMMLTLRMTRGGAAMRVYVLGNGSAFGTEIPPGPVAA